MATRSPICISGGSGRDISARSFPSSPARGAMPTITVPGWPDSNRCHISLLKSATGPDLGLRGLRLFDHAPPLAPAASRIALLHSCHRRVPTNQWQLFPLLQLRTIRNRVPLVIQPLGRIACSPGPTFELEHGCQAEWWNRSLHFFGGSRPAKSDDERIAGMFARGNVHELPLPNPDTRARRRRAWHDRACMSRDGGRHGAESARLQSRL